MSETTKGMPVDAEHVCRFFDRTPTSLIEEPEVCEWCIFYEDGYCVREEN